MRASEARELSDLNNLKNSDEIDSIISEIREAVSRSFTCIEVIGEEREDFTVKHLRKLGYKVSYNKFTMITEIEW